MRINRTDKKVQIRKKGMMTLHRQDKQSRSRPGRVVKINYGNIKNRNMEAAVTNAKVKKPVLDDRKPSQGKIRQRAKTPASVQKKSNVLKKTVMISAIRREGQEKDERLDGERELMREIDAGSKTVKWSRGIANPAESKQTLKRVKTSKMKINRVNSVETVQVRNSRKVVGRSRAGKSQRQSVLKGRGTRFKIGTMISNFIGKKQEQHSAEEELGIKRAIQNYLLAGAAGLLGQVILVALPVILIIVLVYNSPLALAMPPLDDGQRIQEILAGYYQDFNADLNTVKQDSGTEVTYANGESSISNFRDVLMVYMVKYYTGSGEIGTVVNDKSKMNLKAVFDEMNYYKHETTTRTIKAGESLGAVMTSAYCSCVICCGQWSGGPTASGVMPTPSHTIAVDAANPFVPMGTKVIFNGTTYTVEDTGNFDRFGVQFDVYFGDHSAASNWGHRSFEAYLADGEENEVEVTSTSYNVYQLTYEDYIALGTLTTEQEDILREMMTSDIWEGFSDGSVGAMVAAEAMTKVGCAYSQANRYAEGFYDCSSLVLRLYRDVAGIELPVIASTQGKYCYDNGMTVTQDMLQPGDLIFYSYEKNDQFMDISHVAIYVGDGMMVHAANTSRGVVYDPLNPSNIGLYGRPY